MKKQNNKPKSNTLKNQMDQRLKSDYEEIRRGSRAEMTTPVKEYLKAIVDTKNSKKVGIPTSIGGYPGRTAVERYKQELEVVTGTHGYGYLSAVSSSLVSTTIAPNPAISGPFSDAAVFSYTDSAYTANGIPHYDGLAPVGVKQHGWSAAKWTRTDAEKGSIQWRTVGMTLEVFPESSFSNQNGRIVLLEMPSHAVANLPNFGNVQFSDLESYPTSRVIRAVQTGAQSEKIVLNYHPRALDNSASIDSFNDFDFHSAAGETTVGITNQAPLKELIVIFIADPGTRFHVTATCLYEIRGKGVSNVKPRLVDSRGMDLVMNTFSHKIVDGYVGKPEHVYESYLASAWRIAKKGAGFINRHQKEILEGAGRAMRTIGGFI